MPDAARARRAAVGGVLMGVGGNVAHGCNIGHGVTGLGLLSLGSLLATASMATGAVLTWRLLLSGRPGLRGRDTRLGTPVQVSDLPRRSAEAGVAARGVRRRGRARDDAALADDQRRGAGAGHRRVEHLAAQEERRRRPGGRRRSRPAARSPGPCGSSTRRRAAAAAPPRRAARRSAPSALTTESFSSSSWSSRRRIVPFISPSSCRLRPDSISLSPIRRRPPSTGLPRGFSASRSRVLSASIPSAPL